MEELEMLTDYASTYIDDVVEDFYKSRILIINESIGNRLVEKITMMILKYNQEDRLIPVESRKKIYIFINSGGGDVVYGMNLLNIIKNSKTPIVTVGLGSCASMALYILAAGHERYCFNDTVLLLHDGQAGYVSTGNKGKDIQRFYNGLYDRLDKFLVKNTNMSAEFLETNKDREYYFWSEEAKEYGIVDKVIGEDVGIEDILG